MDTVEPTLSADSANIERGSRQQDDGRRLVAIKSGLQRDFRTLSAVVES
jgi:hypothetical protein